MKKVLSILLAMLMIGSVATISTMAVDDGGSISAVYNSSLSASRFNDFSSITPTYQAAVSYMADNGILSGYADNTFNPKGVLTRGAASKIVSNLILGPSVAEKLAVDSAPFKDVPIDNAFAGYIAYCSANGICNGYSDGSFQAFAPLTTGSFAKMLLNFVEYSGDSTRYVGNNWANNVRQDAIAAGIIDSDANLSTPVTREYAAYMSYNAMMWADNHGSDIHQPTTPPNGQAKPETPSVPQYPSAITFSASSLTIKQNSGGSVQVSITPSNAANKNITWSSSNRSVATVDSAGYVWGISAGTATITATTANGLTATYTVTVTAIQAPQNSSNIDITALAHDAYIRTAMYLGTDSLYINKAYGFTRDGRVAIWFDCHYRDYLGRKIRKYYHAVYDANGNNEVIALEYPSLPQNPGKELNTSKVMGLS